MTPEERARKIGGPCHCELLKHLGVCCVTCCIRVAIEEAVAEARAEDAQAWTEAYLGRTRP